MTISQPHQGKRLERSTGFVTVEALSRRERVG
jgi:hypothetical protein